MSVLPSQGAGDVRYGGGNGCLRLKGQSRAGRDLRHQDPTRVHYAEGAGQRGDPYSLSPQHPDPTRGFTIRANAQAQRFDVKPESVLKESLAPFQKDMVAVQRPARIRAERQTCASRKPHRQIAEPILEHRTFRERSVRHDGIAVQAKGTAGGYRANHGRG